MKNISIILVVILLFTGCPKCHKSEKEHRFIVYFGLLKSFEGSFTNIETYLEAPQDVLISFDKGPEDLSCRVREAITFLETATEIKASKPYEITGIKLSEEDSALLSKDLEKWKNWYEENGKYLFFSEDRQSMMYKKGDVERIEHFPSSRCKHIF